MNFGIYFLFWVDNTPFFKHHCWHLNRQKLPTFCFENFLVRSFGNSQAYTFLSPIHSDLFLTAIGWSIGKLTNVCYSFAFSCFSECSFSIRLPEKVMLNGWYFSMAKWSHLLCSSLCEAKRQKTRDKGSRHHFASLKRIVRELRANMTR